MGMGPKAAIEKEARLNGEHHWVRSKWNWEGKLLGWNLYICGGLVLFLGGPEGQAMNVDQAMDYLLSHSEQLNTFTEGE